MALGSDSAVKFRIENQQEDYKVVSPAEISYIAVEKRDVANEEESKGDDSDMDEDEDAEPECEVLVTV